MDRPAWFLGASLFSLSSLFASPSSSRELTFRERVDAQIAVERVYHAHTIDARLPFEQAIPRSVIEQKVARSLRLEAALTTAITQDMLDREVKRIAESTRLPDRLREIYSALGNDSVLIAEVVARPMLVDRLSRGVAASGAGEPCAGNNVWENGSLDDAPHPRQDHSAVWTGSLMLVWGGNGGSATGQRYDPATDSWSRISTIGAPSARYDHTAVWTGTRMLVWGGRISFNWFPMQSGGSYDPLTDTWTALSVVGAPSVRFRHSAVWTGSRMIIWGGHDLAGRLASGGIYDPQTDSWLAMSVGSAPTARNLHTAVWTGSRMVVWGGSDATLLNSGGVYDPVANIWTATSLAGAPVGRRDHTAIWTGTRMIIWGGDDDTLQARNDGASYDPATDSWSSIPSPGTFPGRRRHSAIWTGTRMIVWGGIDFAATSMSDGTSFDPVAGTWTALSSVGTPVGRSTHRAVWTGSEMIVWGGRSNDAGLNHTGGRYNPVTDTWVATASGASGSPSAGSSPLGVWTGSLALIWGNGNGLRGARYDPAVDSWTPISEIGSPERKNGATAIWTGTHMVVWGGSSTNTGGRYDPLTDTWTATSVAGAPSARQNHTAIWTGTRMIVFGGVIGGAGGPCGVATFADGASYDPVADAWQTLSPAPITARESHVAAWTGNRMIVWGGHRSFDDGLGNCADEFPTSGARYDPATGTWTTTTLTNAPQGRRDARAVWTGSEMMVWGGLQFLGMNTGGRYDPATDQWRSTSLAGAPSPRTGSGLSWTGSRAVAWGGTVNSDSPAVTSTGGIYDPVADAWQPTNLAGVAFERTGHLQFALGADVFVWGGTAGGSYLASGGRLVFSNPDADADGIADSCDACPNDPNNDADGDALCGNLDNCPFVANAGQTDSDNDTAGDACDNCAGLVNPSQANADGDAFGDACDNCANVASANQTDTDIDGDGDVCDNCVTRFNAAQRNSDSDSFGDLCDNCSGTANATQSDVDGDGAGDACDCEVLDGNDRVPAEARPLNVERIGAIARLTWPPVPGADSYAVSRALLSTKGPNRYGSCLSSNVRATTLDDASVPPAGDGYFYLVQPQSWDCGYGSLGFRSTELPRQNLADGRCEAVTVFDAHTSVESTTYGTVTGTVSNTTSSDQQVESITEVLSTGGSPASKFSRLEHRFEFNLTFVPWTTNELHVEGFRSSSTDGDGFLFEYSLDGVTWTPIALVLPTSDTNVDLIGALPSQALTSISIRVVDTDRTAGHQSLDTVSIDEIWVRQAP